MITLKDLDVNEQFRLYSHEWNPVFRKEQQKYPGEFGDVMVVVTQMKDGKQRVIEENHPVYRI